MSASFPYEDIVSLPHPVSKRHAPMPLLNRAAQFAPFAALTGYDAAIGETARWTEEERILSDSEIADLDRKLRALIRLLPEHPEVTITYFQPDARKTGGAYLTVEGSVTKVDGRGQCLILDSGDVIPMKYLIDIRTADRDDAEAGTADDRNGDADS